ncbi:hypothetical protein P168DRAFT_331149 [Aspergillus campestris IBT 28561]|uniref:WSC domain-containing protein n=1 Tax=Aspergillus campestris (strain IBT 28561) TaxID=1392248 RepID=A0A2I1DD96_ASPC2|nr:uncharacterized protein P168DRAFT_331149 [Aspergillus campestris IBT 28561]PKY07852.1 hypothetical protein P168DRAFT_331149 [Aspergillus campestris IBT 28561]
MTSKVLSLAFISLALSTGTSATIRQGCYNSAGDLQLIGSDAAPKETSFLSPATCQQTCKKLNHQVFALHDANKCYCGDELPPFAAMVLDTECDEECAGYPGLNCGGKSAWTVQSSTIAVHHQPKPKLRLHKRTSPIPAKDEEEEDDGDISHIITASDDADYEPGHTLSVNPTIVQTGGSAPPSKSGSAKENNSPEEPVQTSILTAPTAAPAKDGGAGMARVAASSTMVPVASGTVSPSSSLAPSSGSGSGSGSSASSSPSASPGAGSRNGVLLGAMVLPVVVGGWLA